MDKVFDTILDGFYKNKVDYKLIMDNKEEIINHKNELIENVNRIMNGNTSDPLIIYSVILLATIGEKSIFPTLVDVFNLKEERTETLFGNTIYDIFVPIMVNTFDGNYHLIEETLLNGKRSDMERGVLFLAYAGICITNKKPSRLVNFIKSNLDNAPYTDFYDDIVDVYLDYKLDSLTVIVKELWLKNKLDVDMHGSYYSILDDYLKGLADDDNSIYKLYQVYANYSEVINLPDNKMNLDYYIQIDNVDDKLFEYINNNQYKGDYKKYLDTLLRVSNLDDLYPETEIKHEITTVASDIEIDRILYRFFKIEAVVYENDEREDLNNFMKEYYDDVIDQFEKYLKNHNFSYDDYDNSRSIHFITQELYD